MVSVADLLRRSAEECGTSRAFTFLDGDFLDGGAAEDVSYASLDAAAQRVAASVAERGLTGRPVLLLYPPGRDYVEGFLGCLYAGAIAVPAYPPDPSRLARTVPRLRSLIADCGASVALGLSGLVPAISSVVPGLDWIATDTLPSAPFEPVRSCDGPALLQYTSGSTGSPKGVVITHDNLMHNAELVRLGFGTSSAEVGMSWLPPYHDMGLIGGILQPIYTRMPTVLMSPLEFLGSPLSWLRAISRYGVTMSGGPNFAFDLCARRVTPSEVASLDLSRWSLAFCGAEPVRAATLRRFASVFSPAGFRLSSFYPCYGLAEATLIVTGGRYDGSDPVSCGRPIGTQRVAIVASGRPCAPGEEGEIWVSGGSVAPGYWGRVASAAFDAELDGRRYLRTGDLGYLTPGGSLVVTGRLKDLIVLRGRNIYPQDLELIVEQSVPAVRPGCTAAFPVTVADAEHVVLACEVTSTSTSTDDVSVTAAIRSALASSADVTPHAVVLLPPRTIPKTSSGKIQRHACRDAYLSGSWSTFTNEALGLDPVAQVMAALDGTGDLDPDTPIAALGLDSLRAVELAHALAAKYNVTIPLSHLLDTHTIATLTTTLPTAPTTPSAVSAKPAAVSADPAGVSADSARELGATAHELAAPSGEVAAPSGQLAAPSGELAGTAGELAEPAGVGRSVGPGERGLWFVARSAPGSRAYDITRAVRVRSALDVDQLATAFDALVRRHPALRACLPSSRGEPVWRETGTTPALERHDLTGAGDGELRERVERDARRGFDIEHGPLIRAALYSRAQDDHVLLLSVHHVVADFWSLSVLADDLLRLYAGERLPELPSFEQPTAPRDDDVNMDYWRRTLDGALMVLELPTAAVRPRVQSFRGATHEFRIRPRVVAALDGFTKDAGATRFATLLAAFGALLSRYAGNDLLIGTPTAGRSDHRSARAVGYFVNPVPLRVRVDPGLTFRGLVAQSRRTVLGALDHAVPIGTLVEALRPPRDPARPPLVQVMLTLQQAPPGTPDLAAFAVGDGKARVRLGGLDVQPYTVDGQAAAFDLALTLAEVRGGLTASLEYSADLFDEPAMGAFARQFATLLAGALAEPDRPLAELALMDADERAAMIAAADGGQVPIGEPSLPELFARQVARRPDAVAVEGSGRSLTYAELDAESSRLAAVLRHGFGVRRGDLVGVLLPRHLDAVIAFWAVLKAGAGLLPLEPRLPRRRLEWLVADAAPVLLLGHRGVPGLDGEPPRLCLDDEWPSAPPLGSVDLGPDDLAYVIYTSGSTGQPKGVAVPHRGACNVVRGEQVAAGLTEVDRVLQYASCAYDVSILEVIVTHLHGATLVVTPPEAALPGRELVRFLTEQRITTLNLSPSALAALPVAPLLELRRLILGGEALPAELVSQWAPGRRFVNAYGPTETTIGATFGACLPDGRRPSIGRAIPNVYAYVLDDRLEPVPPGVPGELFVGGAGVARGYLGRPALTAELFLPDPYAADGTRMYRTGDLVRWLPDGAIDYLGRLDDQVQIRGVRVEPGEVAARLRELFALREVAVVPQGAELVAYLVANGHRPTVAELRARLRAELPEPSVPAAFVYLDELPLTSGQKLDRRALPAPASTDRGSAHRLAPRTDLEGAVARVWADVLGHDTVGVRDHFFDDLGGTSLHVTRVTSALADRLGLDVPVTHLFEHPTVEALVQRLAPAATSQDPAPVERPPSTGTADQPGPRPEDVAETRRRALARRHRRG